MKINQPVPEGKGGGGGESEQGENVDDRSSANDPLNTRQDQGTQRDDPPARVQSPPPDDRTPIPNLDGKDNRNLWERLMQARGKKLISGSPYSSTRFVNASKPIPRQPWHWSSSLFPIRSSTPRIDVAACRDEDRYGITPESDAEAAAAMQRTNDGVADSSTRPGQPTVGAQVSQGQSAQASTSGPEEIGDSYTQFCAVLRTRMVLH
ncbi:hypothetical protein EDB19DRAFT_2026285 [Suillus lakei]|nr:hypothetical protein EDB19DRAFT_2026285 [Suillus lakei]